MLNRAIDTYVIDGAANGMGTTVESSGQAARRVETGNVEHYVFVYVVGALGIVAYYLYLVAR